MNIPTLYLWKWCVAVCVAVCVAGCAAECVCNCSLRQDGIPGRRRSNLTYLRLPKFRSVLQFVTVCCSVVQCGAVCCSVLQCVAVCCSVLQCVAVCIWGTDTTCLKKQRRHKGRHLHVQQNNMDPVGTCVLRHLVSIVSKQTTLTLWYWLEICILYTYLFIFSV